MGGCSGQTKQASEVLRKALSLSPGWGLACPGPPPQLGRRGQAWPRCSWLQHRVRSKSHHHLVSALTPQLHPAARGWVPFLQMLGKV